MTVVLNGVDGIRARLGEHLGYSDYITITQEEIDRYAELSGDHQWIHVDPVRAASGPFGTTIAHGMLTLAKTPVLAPTIYRIDGMAMGVHYGYAKIRFPSPVPVGSRIRLGVTLQECADVSRAVQVTLEFAVEVEGASRPACVAEMLLRYTPHEKD